MKRPAPLYWIGSIAAAAAVGAPLVITSAYGMGVLHLALVFAILTLGFNFTQGLSGRTSLGHVGFWAIGAYATALLTGQRAWPPLASMLVGVAVALLFAFVLAVLTNALQAFYLALATLGFGQIVQVVAVNWTEFTGGSGGVGGIPPIAVGPFSFDTAVRQYYLLVGLTVVGAVFTHRFITTKRGREAFAMRQSEIAAECLGLRTRQIKTLTLSISAVYAAIAGSMYGHVFGFISPDIFSFTTMLLILAMLVAGGQGTVWGPVVGGMLVTVLPEVLRVGQRYWLLLYGIGLFFVMLKMPGGIAGLVRDLTARLPGGAPSPPQGGGGDEQASVPNEEAATS